MTGDSLLDHSSRMQRIETIYDALKSIGDMDIRSFRAEGWLDELYETDHGQENDDEGWMDDYVEDAA